MEEETIKERIERFKIKAENFKNLNLKAFIRNINNTYFFCYIILVGEEGIYIQHFSGPKKVEKERLFWEDIIKFEEFKEP